MGRHHTAIRWISVAVTLTMVIGNGIAERFLCPRNCSCAPEGHDEYELSCPDAGEQQISVQLKYGTKAIIQCQVNTDANDYRLLSDVYLDVGTSLELRLCPLPDVPFTDLWQIRHATKIQNFTFKSYRSFNDTLKRDLFKRLTGITTLSLANNGLTSLPSDLFMDMPHLQHLYLPNNLVQLPADLFQPVLSLETVELGRNELTALPIDLFRNLKKLQLLNLWNNKITNLSAEMFKDLISLTSLDLRHNILSSLPPNIFKYLISLKNLSLNGNNFRTLPESLFSTNKKLVSVQICDGRDPDLILPHGLFSNLPNLTTVDLHNNNLKEVPEDMFWESTAIVSISLQNNHLRELPSKLFKDNTELEKLFLGSNNILSLPDNIFGKNTKLRILDLSFNKLMDLKESAFSGALSLEELHLQNNALRTISVSTFPKGCSLKYINLANNRLSFSHDEQQVGQLSVFGSTSVLQNCGKLEKIDLSNNSISEIFLDWRLNLLHLRLLNLSHNALEMVTFDYDAFHQIHSPEIDVRYNKISIIDLERAEGYAEAQNVAQNQDKRQKWFIDGNPLSCNCSNYDFLRYVNKKVSPELLGFVEFVTGSLVCSSPEQWKDVPVSNMSYKAVTCPITPPGVPTNCSYPCTCEFRRADMAIIVDCIGKNLTEAPPKLPTRPDSNRTELYLTDNSLIALPDFSLPGYQYVSKLAIGKNNISSLGNVTMLPPHLQVIELHNNNLSTINYDVIQVFSNLTTLTNITLHGNPWMCDCQLQHLVTFVRVHYDQVWSSLKYIMCSDGQPLSELTITGLCSQLSSVVWASLVAALLVGALIGGMFAIYYRFTHEIKAWLFAHNLCLWFVTEEDLDKDKQYDAFVSYSHKDEEFVVNELVRVLEGGPAPFKLCLHYRDWVAGEFIPHHISRSVENSRRTLVVLSPNFLESEWGKLEFGAAHRQALREGRARVIIVLLGDIGPTDKLDPELRAYLNMNTYVKWGDPWFWKKLRYALPHPPKDKKGNVGLVNRNTNYMNGKSTDDKIELV